MNRALGIVIATLLLVSAAFAQMEPPKPGPEHKKLDYFVGSWASDGDMKPSPFGPGGKITAIEESKWMDGGFFVVIHSTYDGGAMGKGTALAVMGYDPDQKVYTYDEYNTQGEAVHSKGTVDGDTWTWVNDMKMGPKTIKGRFTMKIVSPTLYNYKYEMSEDGTKWNMVMEGKDTKKQ